MAATSSKRHLQVWQGTVRLARKGHQACVRYGIPTPVGGGRGRASNHGRVGPFINGGGERGYKKTDQSNACEWDPWTEDGCSLEKTHIDQPRIVIDIYRHGDRKEDGKSNRGTQSEEWVMPVRCIATAVEYPGISVMHGRSSRTSSNMC